MVTEESAGSRLGRLLARLLTAAEASLAAGDIASARATAEEVLAVDPDNARAAALLGRFAEPRVRDPGQRALMTLLFSDLVGSTQLSEQVQPEQLRDLFGMYRATAQEAVERYGGSIVQYMGDGILAAFGFPQAHEDDARRAVLAGLDLVAAMASMRQDLDRRLGAAPQVRVGVHTGRVLVTDIRSDRSVPERDSIVGNAPNLAARIQGAAAPDQVVISDVTEPLVESEFFLHSLGDHELKGIGRPVEVFAVDRPRPVGDRMYADRYRRVRLIGREEQRSALVAAWRAIQAGNGATAGCTFILVGEPGIGKTRLVADVVAAAGAPAHMVLGAGCLPYYSNVALWPVSRMLERLLAGVGEARDPRQQLIDHLASIGLNPERSVPFLAPLIGAPPDSRYPAPQLHPTAVLDETLTQLVEWLAALGEQTPRLLVVEDLHWGDPSTLALMGRLAQRRPRAVLTVATTRSSAGLNWTDSARVLCLEGLGETAAVGLIEALTRGSRLTGEVRASIIERAEGIPLFIEELTRSVVAGSGGEPIPVRLQELFTWRLKSPLVDLRVAQAAATVGPIFDAGVLSDVIADPAAVAGQLVVLANAGVIQPVDPDRGVYRFRHALMRDAAYETQVLDVRAQTHARVAKSLLSRGAQPALVAEHLDRAGDAGAAAQQYALAAWAEQAHGAHSEAAKLLSRGLELVETLPESPERDLGELTGRMLRAYSVLSVQGYAAPAVEADHRRAEVLTERLGDRQEVLPSLIAIYAYHLTRAELSSSRSIVDRLVGMVSQDAFSWFEPEVAACAAYQEFFEGRISAARAKQQHALDGLLSRPREQRSVSAFWPLPHDPIAAAAVSMACMSALRGEQQEVERWERMALDRAQEMDFPRGPWTLAFVKTFCAWIRQFRGEDAASRAIGAEVVAIAAEHGWAFWKLRGSALLAGTSLERTDPEALAATIATMRAGRQRGMEASNLAVLARLVEQDGDLDRAAGLVGEALDVVARSGERLYLPELLRQRARYTLARIGPVPDVVDDLNESLRVATEQGALVSGLRAAVALASLPPDLRPGDWRSALDDARAAVPDSLISDDTIAADDLLR